MLLITERSETLRIWYVPSGLVLALMMIPGAIAIVAYKGVAMVPMKDLFVGSAIILAAAVMSIWQCPIERLVAQGDAIIVSQSRLLPWRWRAVASTTLRSTTRLSIVEMSSNATVHYRMLGIHQPSGEPVWFPGEGAVGNLQRLRAAVGRRIPGGGDLRR